MLSDCLRESRCASDGVFSAFLECCPVFSVHCRHLNLLFGNLLTQELNSLGFLLVARIANLVVADLQIEFIDFAFSSPFTSSFVLKLCLEFVESSL